MIRSLARQVTPHSKVHENQVGMPGQHIFIQLPGFQNKKHKDILWAYVCNDMPFALSQVNL